jgi:hypothetical protein
LEKNPTDQDHADTDLKSDKRSFQAFAVIIIIIEILLEMIIESTSSKQENSKLAPNHQNAADFQISIKNPRHLTTELTTKLIPELAVELTPELSTELTSQLTPELNTELATALNHEMNPEIETSESYETVANDDHSSSFTTTVLKLRGYVERKHSTINELIMPHAST